MKPDHIRAGKVAHAQYSMLLQAFRGMLALAIVPVSRLRPEARVKLVAQASAAGHHFVGQFTRDFAAQVNATVANAIHDSGAYAHPELTEERMAGLKEHAASLVEELTNLVNSTVARNIGTVIHEQRQALLAASFMSTGMGARMNRVEKMNFTARDVAGRAWRAPDLVASAVSKAILQLYVEVYLYGAALQGDREAQVVCPDPAHKHSGLVFSIVGSGENCFDTIRDAIWHPNSTAGVQRVHS
jgi:hypothetical protein